VVPDAESSEYDLPRKQTTRHGSVRQSGQNRAPWARSRTHGWRGQGRLAAARHHGPRLRPEVRGGEWPLVRRHRGQRRQVVPAVFRLAVGRFQPNSLTDEVCLSRVSTIDFVQPLPSRLLTVLRHGNTDPVSTATLRGCTYIGNSAESQSRRGHRGAVLRRTR
jgi:hypothetical protein